MQKRKKQVKKSGNLTSLPDRPADIQVRSDYFTPAVNKLAQWALDTGVIKGLFVTNNVRSGTRGVFHPKTKVVEVAGETASTRAATFLNEFYSAIRRMGKKSTSESRGEMYSKLAFIDRMSKKPIVEDVFTASGKVASPLYGSAKLRGGLEVGFIPPVAKTANRFQDLARQTANRRLHEVSERVPEGMILSRAITRNIGPYPPTAAYEEAESSYLTDSMFGKAKMGERSKELGMYMLDWKVPMPLVESIVREYEVGVIK